MVTVVFWQVKNEWINIKYIEYLTIIIMFVFFFFVSLRFLIYSKFNIFCS